MYMYVLFFIIIIIINFVLLALGNVSDNSRFPVLTKFMHMKTTVCTVISCYHFLVVRIFVYTCTCTCISANMYMFV